MYLTGNKKFQLKFCYSAFCWSSREKGKRPRLFQSNVDITVISLPLILRPQIQHVFFDSLIAYWCI